MRPVAVPSRGDGTSPPRLSLSTLPRDARGGRGAAAAAAGSFAKGLPPRVGASVLPGPKGLPAACAFSLRAGFSPSDASVRHLSAVRHRRTLPGSPRKPPRSSSANMSSSSRPRSFAPRTKAAWLRARRTRSGSGSSRRLGSSARMASTGVPGARALSRRQSTTPSHRPSQNACRLV